MRALPVALACLLAGVFAVPASAATPTFAPMRSLLPSFFPLIGPPISAPTLTTGDLNGDGRSDLALSDAVTIGALAGTADTGFFNNYTSLVPAYLGSALSGNEVIADLTGDGVADILTVEEATGEVMVSASDTFGAFQPGCGCGAPGAAILDLDAVAAGPPAFTLVAVGDLNGDGIADLVVSDDDNQALYVYRGVAADWIASPPVFATTLAYPTGLVVNDMTIGDFEGSGADELAITYDDGSLQVLDPGAGLTFPSTLALDPLLGGPSSSAQRLMATDLTGDGRDDLIVSDTNGGRVVVYRGGTAFGANPRESPRIADAGLLAAGDLNGDGRSELVVTHDATNSALTVLEASTTGATTELTTVGSGTLRPSGLALGDFDGDGRADLVSSTDDRINYARNTSLAGVIGPAGGQAFGSEAVGAIGPPATITLTNTGAAPLRVSSIRSDSDDFMVTGGTCLDAIVAVGATCQARVRFAPSATGARSGTLRIVGANDAAGTVALSGTGTAAPPGTSVTGPIGPTGATGPAGPAGAVGPEGRPVSRGHARCRIRGLRIQCVVYNAKTQPWRFASLRTGTLGKRQVAPGRYRLTVIHVDDRGRLKVYRRTVRVR